MNDGKICVSVCAETAEELQEKITRVGMEADLIELRFDCLKAGEIEKVKLDTNRKYILTFRPKEQGGYRELSLKEREDFWRSHNNSSAADFEEDIIGKASSHRHHPVIASHHDFTKVPDSLDEIYERLKATGADIVKIAVQADDITDAIPVWKLLETAKSENKRIIPIAMGEAGKWTRILGLAHGAFLTFAALEGGGETAPGQIDTRDLIETYRVRELNEETEIYGILASDTSYSFSPFIHNAAFKKENLNAVFIPLQVKDLDEFIRRMVREETREIDLNFKGFAVTIPHKQTIIRHLDYIDDAAKEIGAVNTVKITCGKLHGFNTDAAGFIEPLKNSYGNLKNAKVAILGAGGAARACIYALKKEGAGITIFARDPQKAQNLAQQFQSDLSQLPITNHQLLNFDIVVNTTPLGTKGEMEDLSIATAEQIESVKLVYDLVYNPFQTRLMTEADSAHVPKIGGMAMLVAQGAEQFRIWTKKAAPVKEMSAAIFKKLS